jgi:hypothetical protein
MDFDMSENLVYPKIHNLNGEHSDEAVNGMGYLIFR